MLVRNIYAMKNVKWIRSIEVVNYDFIGYWQRQGWSDSAPVNTNTRIDLPGRNVRWRGGAITGGGVGVAGGGGGSKGGPPTAGGKAWGPGAPEGPPGAPPWGPRAI